jgi:DNA ligase 1
MNFSTLYSLLDQTNKTNEKLAILKEYFLSAQDKDKLYTLGLFMGKRPRRTVNLSQLSHWAVELANIPEWLFWECYHITGDLAENISLLFPNPFSKGDSSVASWVQILVDLKDKTEEEKKSTIIDLWKGMSQPEMLVFNKLITGSLRIGVSRQLVVKALADVHGLETSVLLHRLSGNCDPSFATFDELVLSERISSDITKPYPFFLAHPLAVDPDTLGIPDEWQAEWKWDGIRAQIIVRKGSIFVWSRGEDLITESFPEFHPLKNILPSGTVIDGEILPVLFGNKPMSFNVLQKRIGRKKLSQKILAEAPVKLFAYDILEYDGQDIRHFPLKERRKMLEEVVNAAKHHSLILSPSVDFQSWKELAVLRTESRENHAEGFMLKRCGSPYLTGRKKGGWWKWKIDPLSVDGVLIYAARGSGRRAGLYTDYTFGVWSADGLVTFAKAYSGLTDEEIREINVFIRKNTIEKFGPVRTVKPVLVFEIGFEGIQKSNRHKSGVALRFPRILRWRKDKVASEANTLDELKELLEKFG